MMIFKLQISLVKELQWICFAYLKLFCQKCTLPPPPIVHEDHFISVHRLEPISRLPQGYEEKEQITGSQADKRSQVLYMPGKQQEEQLAEKWTLNLKCFFPVLHPLRTVHPSPAQLKRTGQCRLAEGSPRKKLIFHSPSLVEGKTF